MRLTNTLLLTLFCLACYGAYDPYAASNLLDAVWDRLLLALV